MHAVEPVIYLASKSPRRQELLRQIGIAHEVLLMREAPPRGPDVDEEVLPYESPADYVTRIAREKAEFAWKVLGMRNLAPRPVLSADTTVVIENQILGKPADATEAERMMRLLSGKTHQVLTSVAVKYGDKFWQSLQISDVTFATLTDDIISAYCAGPEPYDKAGGYGIQGKAAKFIRHINGSYSGIMGLPLHEAATLLSQAGIAP